MSDMPAKTQSFESQVLSDPYPSVYTTGEEALNGYTICL
jgi:hypothetical protein